MGWTFENKSKSISIEDFFKERFNGENDYTKREIIACSVKNFRTAYLAYKITDKSDGGVIVVAIICLLSYRPKDIYNFGYKDMDENCGPVESKCPEKILKLLTPTDNEYAKVWRERCWENVRINKEKRKK